MKQEQNHLEVIILAAGKGTRMKSKRPKVLHEICGISILEKVICAAAGLKPRRIVPVIGYGEEAMREEIRHISTLPELSGLEIVTAVQNEQLGTGHAAKVGLEAVSSDARPILILSGDMPLVSAADLTPVFEDLSLEADLAVLSCIHPQPTGFGRIVRDEDVAFLKIVEDRDATVEQAQIQEINTSIYLGKYDFLKQALSSLSSDNTQKEYYLTDIVEFGVREGAKVVAICTDSYEPFLGANDRAQLSALETRRRSEINHRLMLEGVTFEDPDCAYIDERVKIGTDCFIGAGSRLQGETVLCDDVVVEGGCQITDSEIDSGSLIRLSSCIESSRIGKRCQIGPFAHLRPASVLHDDVKVGNFVETKKAKLHPGVKANHLTYLGDAEVGAKSNIGAGTITCNYDGKNKFKTVLGEACFIGSNSALVAPVCLGDGAYVGAGSTITKDVPSGALGIARGRQKNVDGWATQKKKEQEGG